MVLLFVGVCSVVSCCKSCLECVSWRAVPEWNLQALVSVRQMLVAHIGNCYIVHLHTNLIAVNSTGDDSAVSFALVEIHVDDPRIVWATTHFPIWQLVHQINHYWLLAYGILDCFTASSTIHPLRACWASCICHGPGCTSKSQPQLHVHRKTTTNIKWFLAK